MPAASIDGPQLLGRLDALASSARSPNGEGVTRLAWSPAELRDRASLATWAADAGLEHSTDAVGNLMVELPGSEEGLGALVTGSHLDTVVDGGPLDGAYGTVAAFEVLGALARSGERLRHPLRAVAFVNEEGVVAPAFTGSRVAAGKPVDFSATGTDGVALAERVAQAGGAPEAATGSAWGRIAGYLELHIEQGPVLDHHGLRIGVVTGITGCLQGWITFDGRANHAGTTPMDLRRDALVAVARAVLAVDALGQEGAVAVATTGAIRVHPGNVNVIAGRAALSFDLRSMDDARSRRALDRLTAEVGRIADASSTEVDVALTSSTSAVDTDPLMRAAIEEAADGLGLARTEIQSGAGHDAQHVASLGPVAMIFVPSIAGVSHNPAERTSPDDLVAGAAVLLEALRGLDRRIDR